MRLLRLAEQADGDVLYASKPLVASFGVALARRRGRPVVLDIDDWELGFSRDAVRALSAPRKLRHLVGSTLRPHLNDSFWSSRLCERMIGRADALTVSNRFLQSRFGGTLVWHGRDTHRLVPPGDRETLRARHGLPRDRPLVLYLGTLRPHKGVDLLARAVSALDDRRTALLLVGVGEDPYARRTVAAARDLLGERLVCRGVQPLDRIAEFLVSSDVVAVPQRSGEATRGQMPAKLFDAMALGRPIVATAVSDIPAALEGCGWVVEPDSAEALGRGIAAALADRAEAERRGELARRKCEREFSYDAMEHALGAVFARFEG
jgi:glycosyltransferase involved in cell wall biosynthesis